MSVSMMWRIDNLSCGRIIEIYTLNESISIDNATEQQNKVFLEKWQAYILGKCK